MSVALLGTMGMLFYVSVVILGSIGMLMICECGNTWYHRYAYDM